MKNKLFCKINDIKKGKHKSKKGLFLQNAAFFLNAMEKGLKSNIIPKITKTLHKTVTELTTLYSIQYFIYSIPCT